MATSGTYADRSENAGLVEEAFERCGILASKLTADHLNSASRSLHFALSSWQAQDFASVFRKAEYSLTLVPNQANQTVPGEVLHISKMVLVVTPGAEIPVEPMSSAQYLAIPNKTATGMVSRVWHDRGRTPRLMCDLVPSTAWVLKYQAITMFQDVGGLANNPDITSSIEDALAAELAFRLSVKFAPDRSVGLKTLAQEAFMEAKRFSRERTYTRFRIVR